MTAAESGSIVLSIIVWHAAKCHRRISVEQAILSRRQSVLCEYDRSEPEDRLVMFLRQTTIHM
jgi:hypothetical protein